MHSLGTVLGSVQALQGAVRVEEQGEALIRVPTHCDDSGHFPEEYSGGCGKDQKCGKPIKLDFVHINRLTTPTT